MSGTDIGATAGRAPADPSEAKASDEFFASALTTVPAMVILRNLEPAQTVELAEMSWRLGVRLVEVPVGTRRALDALAAALEAADGARRAGLTAHAGAGTVRTTRQVEEVARLGARFTVAPGWDRDVAAASLRAGMPHLPGVMSPTDVHAASSWGLGWLKLFPAAALGPDHLTALRGPFPDVHLVATGGIGPRNALLYLGAGASAVSFGSSAVEAGADELAAAIAAMGARHVREGSVP